MIVLKQKYFKSTIILFISFFILFSAVALHADSALTAKLDACLSDPALTHGIQGVMVQSLKDGAVMYERNADLALIPASNLKLIVSAAALDMLSPDAQLTTSLFIKGPISRDGILKGDIILKGGGDPLFSSEQLAEMAKSLWRMGVKTVTGNLIADDTIFDDTRLGIGWSWDYESYGYAAQISALNLDGNSVKVWVYPGKKIGNPAIVKLVSSTSYTVVKNSCVTVGKKIEKKVSIDRLHGRNVISVSGSIPLGYSPAKAEETLSVDDPTSFASRRFIETLKRMGINVKRGIKLGVCPSASRLIAVCDSPSISEMINVMNKSSVNLIAECLLKTLGYRVNGEGKASAGHKAERDFLQRAGADMTAVSLIDGSGLSRSNYISTRNITTLLKYMYTHKYSNQFIDSLPIAGVDGTLKNRMKGTSAEGTVKAKTGYVSAVCVISGYANLKSGEPVAFCIMMNNHLCTNKEAQTIQDQIITAITD